MIRSLLLAGALGLGMGLAACAANDANPPGAEPAAVAGFVTDREAFDRFIATQPSAEQFRRTYPDVTLVMPGDISTRELRHNNSRYFAEVDAQGRISGGRFM